MIHVEDLKKLNDFKEVYCCRPRDLYSRFGKRLPANPDFQSSEDIVPMNMSKIESIEYIQNYDRMMQEQANCANDESVNRDSQNDDSSGES